MNRSLMSVLLCWVFFSFSNISFSQVSEVKTSPFRFLFTGALELGGDEIAEVYFTNGGKQGVHAGQGISFGVGGQLQIPGAKRFLLRSTVGFKYVTTEADDFHIRLTRVPIALSANYMATPKLRLGAGLSMHRNIRFKTDGLSNDYKFKGANGFLCEIAYAGIGLTYTGMEYKDLLNQTYSANAIGVSFSIAFPHR